MSRNKIDLIPEKPDQTSELKFVSPSHATYELEMHNNMNRPINPDDVDTLARLIGSGKFVSNGQTVSYDTDGEIVDGQHRFAAVVRAGIGVWLWVIRGLEPEVRPTIDDNNRRKFRDDLGMNKVSSGASIEALLRKIMLWDYNGGLAKRGKMRGRVMRLDLANEYVKRVDEVNDALSIAKEYPRIPMSITNRAFLWWLLTQHADRDLVRQFFSILSIGSQLSKDDVVVRFRDKIISERNQQYAYQHRERYATPEHIFFAIRTWDAWVKGERLVSFMRPKGGITNPFPVPVNVGKETS